MRIYEIMFIVNPNTPEDEIDKINGQMESVITSAGGRVQKVEKMGRRKLAYQVKKCREGFYVLFAIEANGDIVKEFERRLRVLDPVIKYLTVRVDEDLAKVEKIRAYRQKRAARRSARAPSAPAEAAPEAPAV